MKEKVKLYDGSEVEIDCKYLNGRKAFIFADKVLNITSLGGTKENPKMACEMNSPVSICWDEIVIESPQRDKVSTEDMQRIYEKYAKKDIDFAIKKKLENLK